MKLYLDTAETGEWSNLLPTGIFHGITTNPLLAARAGFTYAQIDWFDLAQKAHRLGAKEFHAQVFGPPESYVDWAGQFYEIGKTTGITTVVKIPLIESAIRQTPAIKSLGGPILMTACYDAKQMFVAQSLGADFIAPYFGRMMEAGIDAIGALSTMQSMSRQSGCEVLVASLRNAQQMIDLASIGSDVFTIAPAIARDLLTDDNTMRAYEEFENASPSETISV